TVVARICLDQLRARKSRREEPLETIGAPEDQSASVPEPIVRREDGTNPEEEALLAESVGLALLVVLDTLTPAERLAFVLHDLFDVPFDEIAPIVGRSPEAARQLASRARRRVRGRGQEVEVQEHQQEMLEQGQEQGAALVQVALDLDAERIRQRAVVDAFLAASRGGDFNALLTLLDPDVVFRADGAAVLVGAAQEVRGAEAVARQFAGRAQVAQPALVNGAVGFAWAPGGEARVAFALTITDGKIATINLIADPERLRELDLALLTD
ncbi:MAG TPA: sigma factor-like helix-turn-helix DNA-binding protein, partial [Ktedonobacterales bacterium]|nr:sigma factor-like helix-turn-helix DNA-binding protein [Ktedonobacterales bacterium]